MSEDTGTTTRVRLLFVDDGAYHHEDIELPNEALERHERLIDCLMEEPDVLRQVHVDWDRLCAAYCPPPDA